MSKKISLAIAFLLLLSLPSCLNFVSRDGAGVANRRDSRDPNSVLPGAGPGADSQDTGGSVVGTGTPIFRVANFQPGVPVDFNNYAPTTTQACGPILSTMTFTPATVTATQVTFEPTVTYTNHCTGSVTEIPTDSVVPPNLYAPNYTVNLATGGIHEWRTGTDPTDVPGAFTSMLCINATFDILRVVAKWVPKATGFGYVHYNKLYYAYYSSKNQALGGLAGSDPSQYSFAPSYFDFFQVNMATVPPNIMADYSTPQNPQYDFKVLEPQAPYFIVNGELSIPDLKTGALDIVDLICYPGGKGV